MSYSAGVQIDGWLFISGQSSLNLRTDEVVRGSIEDETRLTLSHIGKVLEAAGYSFEDVVKCTCHLADIRDFDFLIVRIRNSFSAFVLPGPQYSQSYGTELK